MKREYHSWHSPRLGRTMEMLTFGHGGEPVLLFPTSFGRFWQNEDFGLVGALADKINAGRYFVACVDHIDHETWACHEGHPGIRMHRHEVWESYLLEEVVPLLYRKSSGGRLTVGGASFGAFLTGLVGLRHPQVFHRVLSMSGIFETERWLGGYHDQRVFYHSPFQWLPGLQDDWRLQRMFQQEIILALPEHDHGVVLDSSKQLSGLLWSKGIGNHLSVWGGFNHDWPVWRQMISHYLPW